MLGSMMFEGGEIIRERIQRYQIQCDYRPGGLFVALNHKQLETLEEQKPTGSATATPSWSCWTPAPFAAKSTATAIPARCWTTAAAYSSAEPGDRRSGRHSPERRAGV
jgi:gamma-glutamylputrescine oxidase